MAGVLTTSTTLPPAVVSNLQRLLLFRAAPLQLYSQIGYRKTMPRNAGHTVVFRRFNGLPLALAPLVEGIHGAGQVLTKADVSSKIQQYGDYVTLTDYGRAVVEHDLLKEAADILGEQAGQTMDALIRDVAAAGTNVFYGGGVTLRAQLTTTTHKVDKTMLDRVVRSLDTNNARRFKEMVRPSTKVETKPIRPAYVGICHPDVRFTLQELQGFISIEKYASTDERLLGEFGAYNDIRFCVSSQAKVYRGGGGVATGDVKATEGAADVGVLNVFAEQAIGIVPLERGNLENIVKQLGSAGTADPMNQLSTSAWKHSGTRLILNDNFMARLEVTLGELNP
jgi:N4-gp56 family major capsid protein